MNYDIEIVGAKDTDKGTNLLVKVPDKQVTRELMKFLKGNKVYGNLLIDDGRTITSQQRKKIYAMIADIAASNRGGGVEDPELMKHYLKFYFIQEKGGEYFSLSSFSNIAASITRAKDFITFLIDYSFKHDIATRDTLLNKTEDIDTYLYLSLKYKKCCICNKPNADIHHEEAIGMGRDRRTINDSSNKKIALCRKHHNQAHAMGIESFRKKYHVYGIKFNEEEVSEWAYELKDYSDNFG